MTCSCDCGIALLIFKRRFAASFELVSYYYPRTFHIPELFLLISTVFVTFLPRNGSFIGRIIINQFKARLSIVIHCMLTYSFDIGLKFLAFLAQRVNAVVFKQNDFSS